MGGALADEKTGHGIVGEDFMTTRSIGLGLMAFGLVVMIGTVGICLAETAPTLVAQAVSGGGHWSCCPACPGCPCGPDGP